MPSAAPRYGGLAIVHFTGPVSSGSTEPTSGGYAGSSNSSRLKELRDL